jgi:hypothetical protein
VLEGERVCLCLSFLGYYHLPFSFFATFNFTAFFLPLHHNSRDIASYAAYAYDATIAAGMGVVAFSKNYNDGKVPQSINGLALKSVLIQNVSFPGYSGAVEFSAGRPQISHYGVGDRTAGVRFKVLNFQPGNGSVSSFSLGRVGTWTTEGGFEFCSGDPTLQTVVTGKCTSVLYGTNGNFQPPDRPPSIQLTMVPSARLSLFFLAAINLSLILFFMHILYRFRKTRLLKASQPSMTWIIITANLFNVARTVLSGIDVSASRCALDIWTGHLAFIAVIAM